MLLLPVSQLTLAGVPSPSYPPVARWGGGRETCRLLVLLAGAPSPSKPPVSRWGGAQGEPGWLDPPLTETPTMRGGGTGRRVGGELNTSCLEEG